MVEEALDDTLIIADTSAIIAFVDRQDQRHLPAVAAIQGADRVVIPAGTMGEIAFMVESRNGVDVMDRFLGDIDGGAFEIDPGLQDIARVRYLARRYADLPLGYVDATVVACAERLRAPILTFDHHFHVVAAGGTFSLLT